MRRLIEGELIKYCWLLLFSLLSVFLFSCEESTGPEKVTTTSTYKLFISAEENTISANGGSTRIFVKVYSEDDTTKGESGVNVNFSATQAGTSVFIHTETNLTDANGYASAKVYGGNKTGTIVVTASIDVTSKEKYSDSFFITVVPGAGLVSASPTEILADGISQSTITATVIDSLGQPLLGALVTFVTTYGVITPQFVTDDAGIAIAILRSVPSTTDLSATVTASSSAGKISAVKNNDISAEKISKVSGTLGSVTVTFKGVTISGTVEKEIVTANEADSILITVNIKETTTGEPVSDANISFSTNLGQLRATSGITDSLGNAEVIFFGGNVSGDALVTATFAEGITYSAELMLIKEIVMGIASNPSVLSANGKDLSTITASLSDIDGNPVQGVTVYFTTTDGVILPSAETDQWGEASVSLRSSRYNAVAIVTAKYSLIEKTTYVEFENAGLSVLATPLVLVADNLEKAQLSIMFTDASNAPIVDGVVTISTTLGTLYTSNGNSSGKTVIDSTSTEGTITAYISSDEAGDAVIYVRSKGSVDSLTIHFTNYTFSLSPEDEEIFAGGQQTNVTAILRDIDGEASTINLDDISFSTTLGFIGVIIENDDGTISAELISGSSAGIATVSASINDPQVTSSVSVNFKAAKADSIIIRSDRPSVKLGGSSASIVATVFDETGNPKAGETVTFTILKGPGGGEVITPGTALTDDRGQAEVSFVTGISGSELDGVEIQARAGNIESNILNLTISGEPKSVKVGYNSEYQENEDGTYSVEITAIVSDVNRNKVVDGTIVNFSLIGDAGVIADQVPTVEGVASTNLVYSPSDAGKTVELIVSAGGEIGEITFPLPGFKPAYFSMTAEPTIIPADGKSFITIRAVLFDQAGSTENVPDGTIVSFKTEAGTLNPVFALSDSGVALTRLTSDKNPSRVKITAKSGDYEDVIYVDFEEVGSIVNEVSAIELTVDNPSIRADGIESTFIRATIKKFDGSIITIPTTVKFETDLGEITSSVLSDSTTGMAVATFSSNTVGTAQIKVSVGTVYDYINVFLIPGPPLSIDLTFDPKSVGIQGSGRNVTLIISALVKDDTNNAVADSNLVKFELIGVVDPEASLSPNIAGNMHESEPVPTVNGVAGVSFHAGIVSGTVRIKATIVDENGDVILPEVASETTEFAVFSGPPYLDTSDPNDPFTDSRITLAGGPLNIYAGEINTENSKSSITVLIGDKYKNPVPSGTAVWFTTTGGIITTSSGFTEMAPPEIDPFTESEVYTEVYEGITYVTLYAGNPFPTLENSSELVNPNYPEYGPEYFTKEDIYGVNPFDYDGDGDLDPVFDYDGNGESNDGIALVTALSKGVNDDGEQVIAWNCLPVIFSKQVATFTVETDKNLLYIGETATLTIRVYDINGNPIVGGSRFDFSSTMGNLSAKDMVTNTPGSTIYSITITNNLVETNNSTDAVVSVDLESPNGYLTRFSPPILLSNTTGIGETYTLSGIVTGTDGVTVTLSGKASDSQVVNDGGSYSFMVTEGENYTVTPTKAGYLFTPASKAFNNVTSDKTQNFTATQKTHTISGIITGANGVTVTLGGDASDSQVVNNGGSYSFTVIEGGNYSIIPSKIGYTFTPEYEIFNNLTVDMTQNFDAE